jgi:Flp pilus assembly CpaF family ATPase
MWPPASAAADAGGPGPILADDMGTSTRAAVAEILGRLAGQLPTRATAQEVMPIIAQAVQDWAQQRAAAGTMVTPDEQDAIAQAAYDQRYGLGPLAAYLRNHDVENVDVNGCDRVFVTYASGVREQAAPVFGTDAELIAEIRRLAARGGQTAREFTEHEPMVTVAVGGDIRLTATMGVTPRPCVSLRRHGHLDVDLDALIQLETLDRELAEFLKAAVKARLNVIVTGEQGAGKTTLMRALASEIPVGVRVATLESEYELRLHELASHPDVIAFETRQANSEGAGGVTLLEIFPQVLRHNTQRILLGEVRTGEIIPMLEAMNSGQLGSMCTLHANSPEEAFDRILILGLRGGLALAERAIHMLVGMAVDLIVHVSMRHDGRRTIRYVSEILQVMPPGDTERPSVTKIFVPDGPAGQAVFHHSPSGSMLRRLEAAGFSPQLLGGTTASGGWR